MKGHWPFAILAAVTLCLILTNLGSDYLWEDEGDTAVLASSILKFGVPKAWDGVTFSDSDEGSRLNQNLVMISHPWLQYYLAATSFLAFGENTFAARLPFAVAGWLTILVVYALVWRITADRWSAFGAAALLVMSVQFLLYGRQCRYYSLNMLFTCVLLSIFLHMKSWRDGVLFALAAILSFHAHPFGIVPLAVLGALTLLYRPCAGQRRWFWLALPAILILTLPWIVLARAGYRDQIDFVSSIGSFLLRFGQYLIECASVTPLIGCAFLWLFGVICLRGFLKERETAFLILTAATLLVNAVAIAVTESSLTLWTIGLRYTAAMIPLMAALAGILIAKISRGRLIIWLPLLLIFGFTNLTRLTPWIRGENRIPAPGENEFVVGHAPARAIDRFLRTGQWLFVRNLWHENPGTVNMTCKLLTKLTKPGDVFITNYEWEPFYFHTRLPQALKVLPDFPVYDAARRAGLPDYVFSIDHVRWIVWRLAWDGHEGYFWSDVERAVLAQSGRLTQIAELDETLWENRENIHFHRFSDGGLLFPFVNQFPPVGIFRVDWPDQNKATP